MRRRRKRLRSERSRPDQAALRRHVGKRQAGGGVGEGRRGVGEHGAEQVAHLSVRVRREVRCECRAVCSGHRMRLRAQRLICNTAQWGWIRKCVVSRVWCATLENGLDLLSPTTGPSKMPKMPLSPPRPTLRVHGGQGASVPSVEHPAVNARAATTQDWACVFDGTEECMCVQQLGGGPSKAPPSPNATCSATWPTSGTIDTSRAPSSRLPEAPARLRMA